MTAQVITSARAVMLPAGAQLSLGPGPDGERWSAPVTAVQFRPDCTGCTDPDVPGRLRHALHVCTGNGDVYGIRYLDDAIRYRRAWDAPRTAAA